MFLHCTQNSSVEGNHFKTMHLWTCVLQVVKTWVLSNLSFSCFQGRGIPAAAKWTSQTALSMMWLLTSVTNLTFRVYHLTCFCAAESSLEELQEEPQGKEITVQASHIYFLCEAGSWSNISSHPLCLWSQPDFEVCWQRITVTFRRFLIGSDPSKYSFLTCTLTNGLP